MTFTVLVLIAGLAIWMATCAWCGFLLRFTRFLIVLAAGLILYVVWLMIVFRTTPLALDAVVAMVAVSLFGVTAFGAGCLVGRLARQFKLSRVEDAGV